MSEDDKIKPAGEASPSDGSVPPADADLANPWDSKAGHYDKPSSAVPKQKPVEAVPIGEPAEKKAVRLNPLLAAALAYAARGWPVFPCSPQNKAPLLKSLRDAAGNKIPKSGGVSQASTDETLIRGWWAKWPKAMIGVGMGENGLFVVDFDPRRDEATGEEWTLDGLKAALEEQMGCALPESLAVRTQSGGVHVYLRQPEDALTGGGELIRNRGNLPLHVDVRGKGGYVIAPPSRMANGAEYRWLRGDADALPVEAPEALIAILRGPKAAAAEQKDVGAEAPASSSPPVRPARRAGDASSVDDWEQEAVRRYAEAALDAEVAKARDAVAGTRNKTISAVGLTLGHLIQPGALTRAEVEDALAIVARQWPEIEKTMASIESAIDKGIADPRDLSAVRARARDQAREWQARRAHPSAASHSGARAPGDDEPFRAGSIGQDYPAGGEEGDGRPSTLSERAKARRQLHGRLARFNRTDLGNAERFRERFGGDFRFSPSLGWLAWDKRRWKMLATEDKGIPGEVLAAVYKMVREIRREAWVVRASGAYDAEKNPAGLDRTVWDEKGKAKRLSADLLSWADKSESAGKLRCVAGLVQPWLQVETDAFDADPYAINVMNGTLRFRRDKGKAGEPNKVAWKIFPHRREDLITKLAPVIFDRNATCPVYDKLFVWAQPQDDMRRYLHQWGGLNLTGEMGEQCLQFWHGGGGNAKSTVIDAWAHAAGDYSTTVGIETFLDQGVKKSGGNPTPDLARLGGVRMLRTSEPEKGAKLAEALIKLVTGGEPMAVRFLNKGFFDLRPLYKLTISGNHWLGIMGTDNGIWRRVKLISWLSQITDAEKDEALPAKLQAEASGIFNRLIAGLLDYLQHGLIEPESVTKATAEYREASDPLGRFLKLCIEPADGVRVQSSKLYQLYKAWCVLSGEKEWSNKGLTQAMLDKGYRKKTSDGVQWLDIRMIREVYDFVDSDGNAQDFTLPDEPSAAVGGSVGPPPDPDDRAPGWGDDDGFTY